MASLGGRTQRAKEDSTNFEELFLVVHFVLYSLKKKTKVNGIKGGNYLVYIPPPPSGTLLQNIS